MANPGLIKTLVASEEIPPYRIVAFGNDRGSVKVAGVGDQPIGTATAIGGAKGGPVDIVLSGLPEVEFGGAVAAGDLLASDDQGRAVKAQADQKCIGLAWSAATQGEIAPYLYAQMKG